MYFQFFLLYIEEKFNLIMTNQNHPYHLVSVSPWPIIISLRLFNNLIAIVRWFHKMNYFVILTIPPTILCIYQWWRDVTREATIQGHHTIYVHNGIRIGIILFIISEILFFFSFFFFEHIFTPHFLQE